MSNVINMSKAGIAAIVFAIALTGCGGESSSSTNSQSSGGSGSAEDSVSSQDSGSGEGSTSSGQGSDDGDQSAGNSAGNEEPVDRTADLSWNAPLQRQNNESLKMAELSGYVINYGQDPENLDQTVRLDNAYTMEYTVEDLPNGTWYFTIQAEDENGLVSPPSDLVSKTIQS